MRESDIDRPDHGCADLRSLGLTGSSSTAAAARNDAPITQNAALKPWWSIVQPRIVTQMEPAPYAIAKYTPKAACLGASGTASAYSACSSGDSAYANAPTSTPSTSSAGIDAPAMPNRPSATPPTT